MRTKNDTTYPIRSSVLFLMIFIVSCFFSCTNKEFQKEADQPQLLRNSFQNLTDVIVHDIFSPPVASRVYAYPAIAAYECASKGNPNLQSFEGRLNELNKLPQPNKDEVYCFPLAAVQAFTITGKKFIFSEDVFLEKQEEVLNSFKDLNMPNDVYNRSIEYGNAVAEGIIKWADKDHYNQVVTMPKFTPNDEPDRWQPTPPDYMAGIEPNWDKVRPFVLDSSNMFVPIPPTEFSKDKKSLFYKEAIDVYKAVADAPDEKVAIAQFWDCNPYVSHHNGHVMFATKKITPGGHWMGISDLVTKKSKDDFAKTSQTFALVAVNLADAFISCWDEKYRSSLVRPETYINNYIDEEWLPILQTPPFPEYTSGHSVISAAAAVTLTNLYGDDYAYVDSVEVKYGLPPRKFNSFIEACEEAAISRFYGGIHYMPAITNGVTQGKKIGSFISKKLEIEK